ncbi:nSTAND1 domain-containing NTPase [Nocardia barduliensis]|uniref:nSTAND1 domain-containing NTPase n=1 Tax=Nocardia barduliensis TaxID=2736643 RepID=UPI00157222FD|nr:ATP-binding protein [Nocardia barduliensis]
MSGAHVAREEFARKFAALYDAAGSPSLRSVAMRAQRRAQEACDTARPVTVSAQRISDWKAGRNVPARFETLAPVLAELGRRARRRAGVSTEMLSMPSWRALWSMARSPVTGQSGAHEPVPYPGIDPYLSAATPLAGRARAVDELTRLVYGPSKYIALVGASGVGKTSLLRAGLLPALQSTAPARQTVMLSPGPDPVRSLMEASGFGDVDHGVDALPERVKPDRDGRLLIIIDQFEELFTDRPDPQQVSRFLAALQKLAEFAQILFAIRADAVPACTDHPYLAEAVERNSLTLTSLCPREIVSVITEPARAYGVAIQPGVTELLQSTLIDRLSTHHPHLGFAEPGAVPLLSMTLRALWSTREKNALTVAGLARIGGVAGIVERMAETAWDMLSDQEKTDSRQVLLHLVTVHTDGSVVRRFLPLTELSRVAARTPSGSQLVTRLTRSRIITVDDRSAHLAHNLLLTWRRLSAWIREERTALIWCRRTEFDAAEWELSGRDPALLYRGARLVSALRHAEPTLATSATEFLDASIRFERDPAATIVAYLRSSARNDGPAAAATFELHNTHSSMTA